MAVLRRDGAAHDQHRPRTGGQNAARAVAKAAIFHVTTLGGLYWPRLDRLFWPPVLSPCWRAAPAPIYGTQLTTATTDTTTVMKVRFFHFRDALTKSSGHATLSDWLNSWAFPELSRQKRVPWPFPLPCRRFMTVIVSGWTADTKRSLRNSSMSLDAAVSNPYSRSTNHWRLGLYPFIRRGQPRRRQRWRQRRQQRLQRRRRRGWPGSGQRRAPMKKTKNG